MKQIYDFEKYAPPALSEKTLRQEFERRKLRRQMFLLALAAVCPKLRFSDGPAGLGKQTGFCSVLFRVCGCVYSGKCCDCHCVFL